MRIFGMRIADCGLRNGIFRLRIADCGLRIQQTHRTGNLISFWSILLEEQDVPPGGCAEMARVIVRISRPVEPVIRHLVPFFAGDLASFAADANTRVGEKSYFDVVVHVGMFALICALDSFANHGAGAME